MSLALYMDHQVDVAITLGLKRLNVDVITAMEEGHDRASDQDLLDRATQLQRAVFTMDTDFLAIARDYQRQAHPFFGVIYAHQRRITVGQAVHDLELMAKALDPADVAGQITYLPF